MELKKYQKRVIDDLNDYLEILTSTQSLSRAYSDYWEARHITVGSKTSPVQEYQNTIRMFQTFATRSRQVVARHFWPLHRSNRFLITCRALPHVCSYGSYRLRQS